MAGSSKDFEAIARTCRQVHRKIGDISSELEDKTADGEALVAKKRAG
jgi:hypothetical protein